MNSGAEAAGDEASGVQAVDEDLTLAGATLTRARAVATRILDRIRRNRSGSGSPETDRPRVFADGEQVAGRYRIVRLLARGGVGQVFEVEDQELGQRVAFKTLHPRYASSPEAIEQFKQEVLLARSVTHENVCRLFDFGRHPADTEAAGKPVYFVTMELLAGETLSDRVRREGRLAAADAVAIARDVARALATAHRKGVIHRDIKGSNVLLVPDDAKDDHRDRERAVVTDFGLALGTAGLHHEAAPSPRSRLEGTPLFMAPEQVTGGPVTTATDIYAFGILLYNMLTGQWPFTGDTAVSTALARMERTPKPPSQLVDALDPKLEQLILRCLERQPADRWPSFDAIGDQLAALRNGLTPAPATADRPPASETTEPSPKRDAARQRRFPAIGLAISAAAAVALGAVLWLGRGAPAHTPPSAKVPDGASQVMTDRTSPLARPALVVLGFANRTQRAELAWLATALEERFSSALAAGGDLLLINGEEAERIRAEIGLDAEQGATGEALTRLGRRSGARWLLTGFYAAAPEADGRIEVEARLQRTDGQAAPAPLRITAGTSDLLDQVVQATDSLRAAIGLGQPTRTEIDAALAGLPAHPDAAQRYFRGMAALRRFEAKAARQDFEQAQTFEPDNPLIALALAQAWSGLGYSARARAAAEHAFRHAGSLRREQQLAIEAQYRLSLSEWSRAEELFRALHAFFPDDLDYGLALASAQQRDARPDQALATLASLRELPAPWGEDPRIDQTEAGVRYRQGDYPRSQEAAARAAAAGRALGAWTLVADALETEARTRIHTDSSLDRVTELLDESRALYESVGHKRGLTGVLLNLSDQAQRRGDLNAAENWDRQALALAEETGNQGHIARAQTSLSIILDLRGRLADGLALKRAVLANYQRRDIKQGAAIMLENLGISLLKLGRPKDALVQFQEAAAAFEAVGDAIGIAWVPYYQGRVWSDLGELALARQSYDRALEAAKHHPAGGLEPVTRFEIVRLDLARGELEAGEREARALVETFEQHGQSTTAAETRVLLARILAAGGAWEEAKQLAGAAQAIFDEQREILKAATAASLLTRGALATGSDSDPSCADLRQRLAGLEAMDILLHGRVTLVLCAAREPKADPLTQLREAEAILATAQEHGLLEVSLQARRLYADLLAAAGQEQRSQAERDTLRREAERLGWSAVSWDA